MKTLKIYDRTVTKRTEYRQYRYKMVKQVTIIYDGHIYRNHSEDIDNPRLRIPFGKRLETRKASDLKDYIAKLGRSDDDKWQKKILSEIGGLA